MALFNRATAAAPARNTNVRPGPAATRSATEAAEDVRLLNNEPSPRRNVPAVAMGGVRRPTVTMPMPMPAGRPDMSSAERRLIVGRDIALAGEIAECDQLVVEGTMEATLRAGKRLDIYQSGIYRGAANVEEADVAGIYDGELNVSGRLRLRGTAKISGRVRYNEIEVEAGAQLSGEFQFVAAQVAANDASEVPYAFTSAVNE